MDASYIGKETLIIHYRTIREAAAHFRQQDPNTAITEYRIRQLVVSGAVPSTRVGKKYLVTIEALEDYFRTPTPPISRQSSTGQQVWQLH